MEGNNPPLMVATVSIDPLQETGCWLRCYTTLDSLNFTVQHRKRQDHFHTKRGNMVPKQAPKKFWSQGAKNLECGIPVITYVWRQMTFYILVAFLFGQFCVEN